MSLVFSIILGIIHRKIKTEHSTQKRTDRNAGFEVMNKVFFDSLTKTGMLVRFVVEITQKHSTNC